MLQRHLARRASKPEDTSLRDVLLTFPGVISFAGGLPDERAFDMAAIDEISRRISPDALSWQYVETDGYPPLREALAAHMVSQGVPAEAKNILVTNGSQQALDLISKLFIDPGDPVLVEAPGYLGGRQAFENYEARLVPVPLDKDGLDLQRLRDQAHGAKFLYTVTTFQNPTGSTLSSDQRREILSIARDKEFFVVEDGAYYPLRYDGDHVPLMKSIDDEGIVLYMGSFSKVVVPGIRVGWIVADETIIRKLGLLKQATDLAGNTFGQLFAVEWLKKYGVQPPVHLYREKRDAAYDALRQHMPDYVSFERVHGGFFFWLALPEAIDAGAMLPLAKDNGVTFVPGSAFGGPAHTLRFSFSQVQPEDIEEGVSRLAATIQQVAQRQDFLL